MLRRMPITWTEIFVAIGGSKTAMMVGLSTVRGCSLTCFTSQLPGSRSWNAKGAGLIAVSSAAT